MPPQNPREWLDALNAKLDAQWGEMEVYDAYYEGDTNLAFVTRKFVEAYGGLFRDLTDNWMPLVVDSSAERLGVLGFRFGDEPESDEDANDLWQHNNLDGQSGMLHTEAIKLGRAYWMVSPGEDPEYPRITAEHPSQVTCEYAPGDRYTRLAGIKRYADPYDPEQIYAYVYLPQGVWRFRTTRRQLVVEPLMERKWELLGVEGNPAGAVPIVPVENNPSLLTGGRSDLARGITRIQDGLNVLLADLLIGAEYVAYPLRILLGIEQMTDAEGNPLDLKQTELKISQSRLLFFANEDAKALEFAGGDLDGFIRSIELMARHLAAQAKVPPHYILGEIVNASGDALKAAEASLVAKVKGGKQVPFGEAHEEMMRLAFLTIDRNDERATDYGVETIWRDPEVRSRAEAVDSAVKMKALGIPDEVLWEKIGATPQEITRWQKLAEEEKKAAIAAMPPALQLQVQQPTNGGPPQEAPVTQEGTPTDARRTGS